MGPVSSLPLGIQGILAALALAFGIYNFCDAFAGGFTRFSAPFPINLFGGVAGIMFGLFVGMPLVVGATAP